MYVCREVAEGVREILPFLKNAKYLSWQWALEELLEIHTQTIEPLDSMMVPEDYLQNGNILLKNKKVKSELSMVVEVRIRMDNA